MTKNTKTTKYMYNLGFDGKNKKKEFERVMTALKSAYPKQFVEGFVHASTSTGFDLVFRASPKDYKNIVATCRRSYLNPSWIVRANLKGEHLWDSIHG